MILVHGFTQSADAWQPLAERIATRHEVLALDAPGHGRSAEIRAGLWDGARLLSEAGGRGAWIGYSMGGRLLLHVALTRPDLVERMVLVSASGGIDDAEERAARVASDEQIARRVERDGVEAFVRWWLDRPLFATLPDAAAALDARLGGTSAGLAWSLRLAGAGRQEPLWDRLGGIEVRVLVVVGELDAAYRQRGERLVRAIGPNARLEVVAGAGHACHLEQPEAWLAVVAPFLDA